MNIMQMRRGMGGGGSGPLPFDAKIAYLESDGAQYIDTGFSPTQLTEVSARLEMINFYSFGMLIAARTGESNSNRFFVYANTNSHDYRADFGTSEIKSSHKDGFLDVIFNRNRAFYVNAQMVGVFSDSYVKGNNNAIYLFGTSGYGSEKYLATGRIAYTKIVDNNILIRDFIPVRVGQVGYMYDKVSGQLFGNAGAGVFILGPDVQ